mgnify:CR=1 FL=1
MKQNKWKHLKFEKYVFVLLLAIELIMSFTFLGFIHIDPISLTTAYIPIVVAGCLLGPLESTLIGLVFGLVCCDDRRRDEPGSVRRRNETILSKHLRNSEGSHSKLQYWSISF